MLTHELAGPHAALHESEPGEVEVDRVLLVEPGQPRGLVVRGAGEGIVEREFGGGAEPHAQVEPATPEHRLPSGGTGIDVDRGSLLGRGAGKGAGARFVAPSLLIVGIAERADVADPLAEHWILATHRNPERAVGAGIPAAAAPGVA